MLVAHDAINQIYPILVEYKRNFPNELNISSQVKEEALINNQNNSIGINNNNLYELQERIIKNY